MNETKLKSRLFNLQNWLTTPLGQHMVMLEQQVVNKLASHLPCNDLLLVGNKNFLPCIEELKPKNIVLLQQGANFLRAKNNNGSKNLTEQDLYNNNPKSTINCNNQSQKQASEDIKLSSNTTNLHPSNKNQILAKEIFAKDYKIPIAADSIDIIVLAHSLEFSTNPHELLRETYRILKPEGYLIISCFNSFSLWGLISIFLQFSSIAPWFGKFISKLKLSDWLQLLGFDLYSNKYCLYNLPINHKKYLNKTNIIDWLPAQLDLPIGSSLVTLACKRLETFTPIKPSWKNQENILPNKRIVAPTSNVNS